MGISRQSSSFTSVPCLWWWLTTGRGKHQLVFPLATLLASSSWDSVTFWATSFWASLIGIFRLFLKRRMHHTVALNIPLSVLPRNNILGAELYWKPYIFLYSFSCQISRQIKQTFCSSNFFKNSTHGSLAYTAIDESSPFWHLCNGTWSPAPCLFQPLHTQSDHSSFPRCK